MSYSTYGLAVLRLCAAGVLAAATCAAQSFTQPRDPGVRGGAPGAGGALPGLVGTEVTAFNTGRTAFQEVDEVADGLGPRFNLDSCSGCHIAPAIGGTSPAVNPQIAVATKKGADNKIPSFLSSNGPIREARFKRNPDGSPDGGVHALFTIAGRSDAGNCSIDQPNFTNLSNIVFRIPTPTFGAGLIEAISDSTLKANVQSNSFQKGLLGISGRLNTNGNDGTVTRFGWKAQNKSLAIFSGEAYNVEQGITNFLFQTEREEDSRCAKTPGPEDGHALTDLTDILEFANFMRFLDQPKPAPATTSINNGRTQFQLVGCSLCHTPSLTTGSNVVAALNNKTANLFSDLALHKMGTNLADDVAQGNAAGNEFRTAPLWGLGQRIFLLHDGRTKDLVEAIQEHSGSGSEANGVIALFNLLPDDRQQDILNFLRSL